MRHLIYATFNKVTFVLPLWGLLPTAAGVVEALRHKYADLLLFCRLSSKNCITAEAY